MKIVKFIFCMTFLIIISFFGITTINNNDKVSMIEKRNLETFPKISVSSLLDGSYFEKLTNAFSDQLEFREYLIKGYYLFQFQRYNGDVVKGDNNELYAAYQRFGSLDSELADAREIANIINDEANKIDAKFIFLSIPRKDAIEKENLPDSYISSDRYYKKIINEVSNNINDNVYLIDAFDIFMNDNHKNRYYYLTDHHITPRGAELLYKSVLDLIDDEKVKFYGLDNYSVKKIIINGSFNNQIGQSVKTTPEELYILPKFDINYTRYEDGNKSNLKIWDKANTYEYAYMKGDKAYTVVDTNRDELPNILIVGSSFTNILESMCVPSFNKVVSIDYRHNKSGKSINDYVKEHNIDYVLFMPSQSNNALSLKNVKLHLGL